MTSRHRSAQYGDAAIARGVDDSDAAFYQRLWVAASRIRRLPPDRLAIVLDDGGVQTVAGGEDLEPADVV
jgi:hypothetical protein